MRAKLLKRAGLGYLLGMALGNFIAFALRGAGGNMVSAALVARMGGETKALIVQTLVSGLYGAATMGGTVLYDIERWPLALSSAAHYLVVAVPFVPMALLLGWMRSPSEFLVVAGIQLVAYFLIWLILYAIYRRQVRELNELHEARHAADGAAGEKE